jgi:hypothetical protein
MASNVYIDHTADSQGQVPSHDGADQGRKLEDTLKPAANSSNSQQVGTDRRASHQGPETALSQRFMQDPLQTVIQIGKDAIRVANIHQGDKPSPQPTQQDAVQGSKSVRVNTPRRVPVPTNVG